MIEFTMLAPLVAILMMSPPSIQAEECITWPPPLPGVVNNTISLSSIELLKVPEAVISTEEDGAVPFIVAKTPPKIDLYFHSDLGPNAASRRLWSSWGDICVASDGRVYVSIGDHGDDAVPRSNLLPMPRDEILDAQARE